MPLDEQDRSRWNRAAIEEGLGLVEAALATSTIGPYQVQAAIAAVHAKATRADDTDWPQILRLYDVLDTLTPSPVVRLNRAVAVGVVHGPEAGLAAVGDIAEDPALGGTHRVTRFAPTSSSGPAPAPRPA